MCLWMNERLVGGSAVAAILKKRKNWSLDDDGAVGLDWIVVGSWLLLQKNVCTHHHLLLHEISHSSQSKSLLIRLSICESKKSRVASFCLHVTYVVVLTGFVSVGQNFFPKESRIFTVTTFATVWDGNSFKRAVFGLRWWARKTFSKSRHINLSTLSSMN